MRGNSLQLPYYGKPPKINFSRFPKVDNHYNEFFKGFMSVTQGGKLLNRASFNGTGFFLGFQFLVGWGKFKFTEGGFTLVY